MDYTQFSPQKNSGLKWKIALGITVCLLIIVIGLVIYFHSITPSQIPFTDNIPFLGSPVDNLYNNLIEYGKSKIDYSRKDRIAISDYPSENSVISGSVQDVNPDDSHVEVYTFADTMYPLRSRVKFSIAANKWSTENGPYEVSGEEKDKIILKKALKYNPPVLAMVRLNRDNGEDPVTTASVYKPTGLVRSFHTNNRFLEYRTYTYDQALVLLAACVMDDFENARIFADALVKIQQPDGSWTFSVNTISGIPTDPYFRTGASMWVIYALAFVIKKFGSKFTPDITSKYKNAAIHGMNHLIDNYLVQAPASDLRKGLFKGGKGKYTGNIFDKNHIVEWCANEHNVDAYFTLKLMHELGLSQAPDYDYGALCKNLTDVMLSVMWNDKDKIAYQAVQDSMNVSKNNSLDNNTWYASMAADAGKIQIAIDALKNADSLYYVKDKQIYETGAKASGYKTYSAKSDEPETHDVWVEGTAGAIHAYKMIAQKTWNPIEKSINYRKAKNILDGYKNMIDPTGHYGIKCSTGPDTDPGNSYCVAATAWTILAVMGNGFWGLE